MNKKIAWSGIITSVQPRIRLMRSFDQRSHAYLGYALCLEGNVGNEERIFTIGVGKAAQEKQKFQVGDLVNGESEPVKNACLEPVEFYKTAKLKKVQQNNKSHGSPPPWVRPPDSLEVYRQRGHRRLDNRTYQTSCTKCIWGCYMPVKIGVDQLNPSNIIYRFETFCYGPKSCGIYKAGRERTVPGRRGRIWKEEDWVDEEETAHREMDE
jgi:hypothetical protein